MAAKSKDSAVASTFWFIGGVNGLVAVIGLFIFFLAGAQVASAAGVAIIAGLSGMLSCFAVALIVQHLCNIAYRLEILEDKADMLETNNQLQRQLLRAYGHEPEA